MKKSAIVKNLRPQREVVKAILELVGSSIDQKEVKKRGFDAPNETYGTISFKSICTMIDELSPIDTCKGLFSVPYGDLLEF